MPLADLLPAIQALPRADKLRLTQLLIVELAQEEGVPLFEAGQTYPIWSPYDSYEAAEGLIKALELAKKGG
jgi:hypothetical protein